MSVRTKRIALLFDFTDCFDLEVVRGILRFARERGNWRLFSRNWLFNPLHELSGWHGDGAIARVHEGWSFSSDPELRVPVVDVAGSRAVAPLHQVTNDDELTGYRAGEYLAECGFHAMAFFGVRGEGWSELRQAGFARAALEAGIEHIGLYQVDSRWEWDRAKYARLVSWLKRLPKPCGLLVADNPLALKVVQALGDVAIAVPSEVSVVTVGNEDVMCELSEPSITSIPFDCPRIGYEAARLLDRLMENGNAGSVPMRVPPLPMLSRESSGRLAGQDTAIAAALSYIRAHVHEGINVVDVVKNAAMCRRSLESRFRKALGHSIHAEIQSARMQLAATHIASGASAAIVARKVGFATSQHFHHAFKNFFNMTPKSYFDQMRIYQQ